MKPTQLIDLFQRARSDENLAVIEGIQALKHAQRFGAEITHYITCDIEMVKTLLGELAGDITDDIVNRVTTVDEEVFAKLSPTPHRTKVMALAKRKKYSYSKLATDRPVVFLEDPRDLENIGAVIRVAAAANAAAVCITGPVDIWHPAVIRGAAGLHWALPVLDSRTCYHELGSEPHSNEDQILKTIRENREVIALDPIGERLIAQKIPKNAVLIFGTERHGISKRMLEESDSVVALPMKPGVSSLNLATSVAATLYQL